jgi:uncharacterized protein (DUF1501 family)
MTTKTIFLDRRSLLRGAGLGLGLLLVGARRGGVAVAAPEDELPHRFVSVYFSGAWDVLLGLDTRDPSRTYGQINLGTDRLEPQFREPIPVQLGGRETLYGATMASMVRHADVTTLFRGINMNTVAHPTGRSYINSFLSPRGSSVRGDSLGTAVAAIGGAGELVLPNVSIGLSSSNVNHGSEVNALTMQRATEITSVLRPERAVGDAALAARLAAAQDASRSCVSDRYGAPRPADQLAASRAQMRRLLADDVSAAFDFRRADMAPLRERFGITPQGLNNATDVGVTAAVASQLLRAGLSSSVTVMLDTRLDTHGAEWADQQPLRQQRGFEVLAALLDELREDDPAMSRTTVLAHSEFARTPGINGRGGRDHWFANSMIVFGAALTGGVFGATTVDNLGLAAIDLATGRPAAGGTVLLPEHVGATVVAALGGDPGPFRLAPINSLIAGSP